MGISHDGWVDWAVRETARQDKRYPEPNAGVGIVWHSQVGHGVQALINIQNSDRPTSYMFWIGFDGSLHQLSPVFHSTWTSGNSVANTRYWNVELEGGRKGNLHQPINDAQLATAIRLLEEWMEYTGSVQPERYDNFPFKYESEPLGNQFEHREVSNRWDRPHSKATLCPSGRYERFWKYIEVTYMTPAPPPPPDPDPPPILDLDDELDDDDRLRQVTAAREALRFVASRSDADLVISAARTLKKEGFDIDGWNP
jgi:hypothetical protein